MSADLLNLTSLNQSFISGEQNSLNDINNLFVENCRDRTLYINDRLQNSKRLAQAALFNAKMWGVHSEFGFRALFKRNEARDAVTAILDHIYFSTGKTNLRPRPDTLSSPRFSCVTQESAKIYDYLDLNYDPWVRCQGKQAFYAEDTSYIFLCPAFFSQPPMSERNHCPSVTDNKFSGNSGTFYRNYQTYIMLYHLIRFYLGHNALADDTDPKEQLDWNSCVGLNTVDSVLNPTNLQIYIACKQSISRPPTDNFPALTLVM